MNDWKGNKIEVGHTVKVYSFKNTFGGSMARILAPNGFGGLKVVAERKIEEEYKWELIATYRTVKNKGSRFRLDNHLKPCYEQELNHSLVGVFILDQPNLAVCIEGLSDDREAFMLNHFTV